MLATPTSHFLNYTRRVLSYRFPLFLKPVTGGNIRRSTRQPTRLALLSTSSLTPASSTASLQMAQPIRFDGRVAIVTGAGGGLGRVYALLLAARGAKVVVNDLGGSLVGSGSDRRAAERVVDEIRAAGGEAIPDAHSVVDGAAIVATAMAAYGRVDVLVANAGILRDASFANMSDTDWETVLDVHLRGTHRCVRAAWSAMREARYGRIVVVTSSSGLYGNFGQANYAAAKMGIVGLCNTLAKEGAPRGIMVNAVAPIAASRMTEVRDTSMSMGVETELI